LDVEIMPRVLVVDDHAPTVAALDALLAREGWEVQAFTAAAAALEALECSSFDAVITDLQMPIVNGAEIARATRKHHPRACLVVMSAGTQNRDELDCGRVCIVAQKPLDSGSLVPKLLACHARGNHGGSHWLPP
jgi:CheY-like chemotaxis protein